MSISRTTKVVVPANPGARPTEREVTVPGRSEPPRPVASPGELRTARFLVVITAVSGLAFAILAVVGFQLILVLLGREITPPPPRMRRRHPPVPRRSILPGRPLPHPTGETALRGRRPLQYMYLRGPNALSKWCLQLTRTDDRGRVRQA